MTHYRMNDGTPSAIILAKNPLTSSLDELRTYNENTIFLNNGNEFQIRLFNPLSEKIGVRIGLNEKYSESFLILNPGQDVTLDRFIDDQKKMLFETYTYDSSNKDAQKAIVNNGNVTIQFFKEKRSNQTFQTYSNNFFGYTGGVLGKPYGGTYYNTNEMGMLNISTSNCTTTNTNLYNSNTTYTSGVDMNLDFASKEQPKSNLRSKSVKSKSSRKETGRVEKGNTSDQSLTKVDVEFEYLYFYQIIYNLKPVSEKINVNYETRNYCGSCGYRLRNNKYNYCPKCGTKIQ